MPQYSAGAVVLTDAETGLVLYEHKARVPMYPASITKVMTALIVLDHAHDLEERIEFCEYSVFGIPRNSAHISMDVDETLTIYQALNALMLESANEVSLALAIHIAGGIEEFVDLMNRRAFQLGAYDTNFVNPSGLPARGHVTTAYDMALIKREAVKHPVFREIIGRVRFDIPPTERQPETRHLLNNHRMLRPGPHFNEYVVGGKTGWTARAGHTLISYAYRDGRRLIATILQGEGAGAFTDTTALFNFGFSLPMVPVTVFDSYAYTLTLPVKQEIDGTSTEIGRVRLQSDTCLTFEMPPGWSQSWLSFDLDVPETLTAPVLLGTPLGHVTVYVQNVRAGEVTLTARDAVFALTPSVPDGPASQNPYTYAPYYAPLYAAPYYDSPEFAFPQIFTGRLAFLNNEYIITLIIPLALAFFTLIIAAIFTLVRRRRAKKILRLRRNKFSRYPHYFKK